MKLTRFLTRTANNLVASGSGVPPWLNDPDNPFIHTLHLRGVSDPLDGDALWEHEYSGGDSIREAETGRPDRRLRLALDAHRQIVPRYDPERGYSVEDPRVFTDVLIRIPRKVWKGQRMTGGGRIPLLLDKLAYRHNQEFQDHLFGERTPRYQVVPEERLEADEVLCQFGLGVFIPDAEDRLRGELQVGLGGRELPLPEWESYRIGRGPLKRITRAAAIYRDQHYLLLSNDHRQSAIQSPLWLPKTGGYLLLDLSGEVPKLEPDEGPLQPLGVEPGSKAGAWVCRFRNRETAPPQTLELAVTLQRPKAPGPAPTGSRASGTIVFTGRRPGPRLLLTGIALPRIDPYLTPGLAEWTLCLNRDGTVAADAANGPTLKGRAGEEGILHLRAAGARQYSPVRPPATDIDGGKDCPPLHIDPPPAHDYLGLLRMAIPKEYLIPAAKAGGSVIGRHPEAENGIALTLLAQPEGLLWDDNSAHGTLNDLVSARFAELDTRADGLHVKLLSRNYPLHLLDAEGRLLDSLQPERGSELLAPPGCQLLLGLYLFRYQPGEPPRS